MNKIPIWKINGLNNDEVLVCPECLQILNISIEYNSFQKEIYLSLECPENHHINEPLKFLYKKFQKKEIKCENESCDEIDLSKLNYSKETKKILCDVHGVNDENKISLKNIFLPKEYQKEDQIDSIINNLKENKNIINNFIKNLYTIISTLRNCINEYQKNNDRINELVDNLINIYKLKKEDESLCNQVIQNIKNINLISMFEDFQKEIINNVEELKMKCQLNERKDDLEEEQKTINNSSELEESPEDEFSKYIFEKINLIRKNPNDFIKIIEESKLKVLEKNGKNFYKSKVKVVLNDGISVFDETIELLKTTQPMNELQFSSKICVPLPENEEDIKNPQYLKSKVEEIKKNFSIKTYWRDIINDCETSFILMIVDDNGNKKRLKRKEILNPEMKYIGIDSVTIGKSFVCYLTLSDKINK